jgi:hypothetical protein
LDHRPGHDHRSFGRGFPVGVFSDLWSKELEKHQAMKDLENMWDSSSDADEDDDTSSHDHGLLLTFTINDEKY